MSRASRHSSTALLDHLARISRMRADATLADLGMRPRQLVALTLLGKSGPMTQQALATTLTIDRTNLVGLLNELESAGLVARRRSPEDRRRHIVELTRKGARAVEHAERQLASIEDELLRQLSESDRETFYQLLQRATAGHVIDCTEAAALRERETTDTGRAA